MENLEDEIEYFGFLPITFTTDLQESLEDTLKDIIHRNSPLPNSIQTQISDSLKKNIFIFNNFVLRNILKFPPNFKLERKITDKVIGEDVNKLVDSISMIHKKLADLKKQHIALEEQLGLQINRNSAYKNLLKNKESYTNMISAAREIRKFMNETTEIYETFRISSCRRENDFENLMEFKNIKNIYYKEEKDRLYGIASADVLEHFSKIS